MKIEALALLLSLSLLQMASADEAPEQFMSWYDGWGVHTVWGIGNVAKGYSNASVICGSAKIEIRVIWDTHETSGEPTETESADYAKDNNLVLLQKFEANGKKCKFELVE